MELKCARESSLPIKWHHVVCAWIFFLVFKVCSFDMPLLFCKFCNISTHFELFVLELSRKSQLMSNNLFDYVKGMVHVLSYPCCKTLVELITFPS
jgi:hypothetical protein